MDFPKPFKYIWWVVAIVLCGTLIYLRRNAIITGTPQTFDTALIAIITLLILLPFFSEMTLLGVTLKRQVEEAKKEIKQDVREQVNSLRTEFQNLINISNRFNPQLFINTPPPPDTQLSTLEEQIQPILADFRRELGLIPPSQSLKSLIPSENTVLAFTSRYQIEREVTRIWNNRFQKTAPQITERPRILPIGRIVEDLVRAEVIPPALGRSIREVYAIGSPAVHGEEPTPEKMSFLNDVVPSLVATLRAIP